MQSRAQRSQTHVSHWYYLSLCSTSFFFLPFFSLRHSSLFSAPSSSSSSPPSLHPSSPLFPRNRSCSLKRSTLLIHSHSLQAFLIPRATTRTLSDKSIATQSPPLPTLRLHDCPCSPVGCRRTTALAQQQQRSGWSDKTRLALVQGKESSCSSDMRRCHGTFHRYGMFSILCGWSLCSIFLRVETVRLPLWP